MSKSIEEYTDSIMCPPLDSQVASDPVVDAVTVQGRADSETPSQKRPNAFTHLMAASKKPKPIVDTGKTSPKILTDTMTVSRKVDLRDGLGIYIKHPEANPEARVVEYDDDFVVINDKFPKASVHLLLIPRNPAYYKEHPLHLLSTDTDFRHKITQRVTHLKQLAASELRRQFGHLSTSDMPYQAALEDLMTSPTPPPPLADSDTHLPPGRDWLSDIVAGVHTHPSMTHMHIHVFSRDMHSPWLKHKKHYLSFNSPFLVQMSEFPLELASARFHPGNWPNWDMTCWRCGRNFRNGFKALKAHLEEEFEAWKKE